MGLFFGKRKKAKQELEELWRCMERNCENNYKDEAQRVLKDYEICLDRSFHAGLISEDDYENYNQKMEDKKAQLKGYNHNQHIGW